MDAYSNFLSSVILSSSAVVLLPLMAMILRWKRLKGVLRIIAAMVLLDTIMAVVMHFSAKYRITNLPLLHVYTVVQFVLWWWVYFCNESAVFRKRIHIGSGILFVLLAVGASVFLQPLSESPSIARSFQAGFIVLYGIFYCVQLLQNLSLIRPEKVPMFWFNAAALMYFSGNLFLFIFSNYLLHESARVVRETWAMHALFLMVYYLLLAIGIWLSPKPFQSR